MLDNGANSFPAEDVGLLRIAFFFFFLKHLKVKYVVLK